MNGVYKKHIMKQYSVVINFKSDQCSKMVLLITELFYLIT